MSTLVLLLFCCVLVRCLFYCTSARRRSRCLPLPPGPKGWPILGYIPKLGPKPHQTLAALSREYGPLIHLRFGGVPVIVASSAATAAAFLKTHDANFSCRPPTSGAEHIAYDYHDMVFAPYGPRWRMLRKLCTVHLVSSKALENFSHVREQEATALVRSLLACAEGRRSGGSGEANVGEELNIFMANSLAIEMMGWPVFGGGIGREAEEFKEMATELMTLAGVFNLGDFVPWLAWLDPQGVVARMKRLHRRYDAMLDKIIEKHEACRRERNGGDLLSVMIGLRGHPVDEDGGTISNVEIKALLLELFVTGTDTTLCTVEWGLAELMRHPCILEAAQREIDTVVGKDRLVAESDLPNLPFLQAVVKEIFRLHPATPLNLPRMASESCEVDGYHIPKGATLLVNIWAITRDPAVWPRPLEFRPERFLAGGEHAHVDVEGNDFELIPFGAGRRICVGMRLGWRMAQFATATLVHAFDWALPAGQAPEDMDMEEAFGITLRKAVLLNACPTPRLNPNAYIAHF